MPPVPLFLDRRAAGEVVARALTAYRGDPTLIVLGMARGGVAVAAPVARELGATLEVMVARKLGVPGIEEVAFGAIAEGRREAALDAVAGYLGIPRWIRARVMSREQRELERRIRRYRGSRPLPDLAGRTVIVVDDGLATGATLKAAGLALRSRRPARLIAAVPVASAEGVKDLSGVFDEVVAAATPEPFETVSAWYHDFDAVGDAEVVALVGHPVTPSAHGDDVPASDATDERPVSIPVLVAGPAASIVGDLGAPPDADTPRGLVIFAHGGGSSRQSYRNRYLAGRLRLAGWASLRVDLLLESEQRADDAGEVRFNIDLITRRLRETTEWAVGTRVPGSDQIVLFGASTGAAAAAGVAAAMPGIVAGVIGRGGRVDLAGDLSRLTAPTLLVVGGADLETLSRNRDVAARLAGPVALRVVPGAGHTFEETGALGAVGELVATWLGRLHRRGLVRRWFRRLTADRIPEGRGALH